MLKTLQAVKFLVVADLCSSKTNGLCIDLCLDSGYIYRIMHHGKTGCLGGFPYNLMGLLLFGALMCSH